MQRRHHCAKRHWKGSEQNDDDENQPNVVRLLDRTDRLGNGVSLLARARPDGQQIPDAPAEIRSAGGDVKNQRRKKENRNSKDKHRVRSLSAATPPGLFSKIRDRGGRPP